MPTILLQNILSTIITNEFYIHKVERFPHNNSIIHAYKYDKLGAKVSYSILFTDDVDESSLTGTLTHKADHIDSTPIIVSDNLKSSTIKTYTKKQFFDFFGGVTNTGLILIPSLPDILEELGYNKLPKGLSGKPPDLHEMYIKECLQFIMESPTRRYGIDRSFESLPDMAVLSKHGYILLVDSKAYSKGFEFVADDIKRFSDYVEDFRNRYILLGRVFSFIVVSAKFNDSEKSLRNRSEELYKVCNCKLSCLSSRELGVITQFIRDNSKYRHSIDWKNIFSEVIVNSNVLKKEIDRINKDNLY